MFLLDKLKSAALWLGGFLLAVGAALLFGFRKGEKTADNANAAAAAKATNEAITKTNEASQRVNALPPNEVRQELQDKWSRD